MRVRAWAVTHSRWDNPPDDPDRVIGTRSSRKLEWPECGDPVLFRLSDDDRVIYYHGVCFPDSDEGDTALEELYRWGEYYAGTTILHLWNPNTWEWEHTIS